MSLPAHPAPWPGPTATRPGIPSYDMTRTATLRLTGTAQGCAQARDFTDRTLDHWELGHCRDDALTIVCELAANAVLHARPRPPADEAESEVWLKLTLRPAHLVCAVTDQSNELPRYSHSAIPLQEHGRGLHIVEALSEHWGWTRSAPTGKTVWAMLPRRSSPLT